MRNPESLLRVYEELADRFIKQNEPRFRDHCLVLAADTALSAQRPQDAERLRQRLLHHNPHHLLRPFASMIEALQAPDVQEYVADLRRQWPPEFVEKLYLEGAEAPMPVDPAPVAPVAPVAHATNPPLAEPAVATPLPPRRADVPAQRPPVAAPVVPRAVPAVPAMVRPTPSTAPADRRAAPAATSAVGDVLATGLLLVGIAAGVGLLFIAFVWPLLN
jgi:hypothetical protein